MWVPLLIMLREGVEAALVVGIIAGYLKRTGHGNWMGAVWVGVLLAVALSLFTGAGLQFLGAEFPQRQQELFEAIVGFCAVGILTYMVFWMRRMARSVKQNLHASLDAALSRGGTMQIYALVGMVFLAVAREGLETVFFLLAVFQQSHDPAAPFGALIGLLLAVAIGYGLYSGALHLNLSRFFRATGLFLLLVAAGILANAVQALHEAGLWNHFQAVVYDSSAVLPADGPLGSLLSGFLGYQDAPTESVLAAYFAYLVLVLAAFLQPPRAIAANEPGHSAVRP